MLKQALIIVGTLIVGILLGYFGFKLFTKKPELQIIEKPVTFYKDTCIESPIDSLLIYKEYKKRLVFKGKKQIQKHVEPVVIIEQDSTIRTYQYLYVDSLVEIKEDVIVRGELVDFSREVRLDTPYVKEVQIITVPTDIFIEVPKIVKVPEDPYYQPFISVKTGYPFQYGAGFGIRFPSGQIFQLDAGRMGDQMIYELEAALPLWKKTIKSKASQ